MSMCNGSSFQEEKEAERQKANVPLYSTPCLPSGLNYNPSPKVASEVTLEVLWPPPTLGVEAQGTYTPKGHQRIQKDQVVHDEIAPGAGKTTKVMMLSLKIIRGALRTEKLKDVTRYYKGVLISLWGMAQDWRQKFQKTLGQGPGLKRMVLDQNLAEKGEEGARGRDAQEA